MAVTGIILVAACAQPDPAVSREEPFDPWEQENRRMHEFNRAVDRTLWRPAGKGYTNIVPDDIETVISRFAENLSLPAAVVNNILQGNMKSATEDTYRFVVNSTLGLGGMFDPATELNMPQKSSADFGETLYTWGVNEGPYMELPLLGPSTARRTVGRAVDLFTNPLTYVLPSPESFYGTGAGVASSLGQRGRFSDTIDAILYESADSYATSRSLHQQNRRFKLGTGASDGYLDPYDSAVSDTNEDSIDE